MVISLMQEGAEELIDQEVGGSLRGDVVWKDHVLEQPCLLRPESTELIESMREVMGPLVGIFEMRTKGVAVFVSRTARPFALAIPFWKLHFAKGPDTLTLFCAEHKIRIRPLNDDLRGFTAQLIEMKLALQNDADGPNPG